MSASLSPAQFGDFTVGSDPVPEIAAGAQHYREINGMMTPEQDYSKTLVTPEQTAHVANDYMHMPAYDKAAEPAYHQMGEEIGRQFDYMTKPVSKGGMGIDVDVSDHDPYGATNANKVIPELRDDVVNHGHITALSSAATGGHPYFSNDQNDMFRAVHDTFGHLGSGRGVDRHGEQAAYQKHAAMFSPLAQQAMRTETQGQNSALIQTGEFQPQKVGLLGPQWNGGVSPGELEGARQQARQFQQEQFG